MEKCRIGENQSVSKKGLHYTHPDSEEVWKEYFVGAVPSAIEKPFFSLL